LLIDGLAKIGDFMIQPIFNRYERKYILTKSQKDEILPFLEQHLDYDPYSQGGKEYTIYNIYFENEDFSIIRNSISKPKFKDKLRLRTYSYPMEHDSMVFLEIKKKYEGRVNKRRIIMTYDQAKDYLNKGIIPQFDTFIDNQVMKEIDYFMKIHKARPGTYIRYDRMALVAGQEELRVTFDHHIIFRSHHINLEHREGTSILPTEEYYLMEIKSEDNFPFWLARKLSEMKLYSTSFSKYGKAFEQYLVGGQSDDELILYDY
jgi:SPX domain protein involved in polyphosphate accumulation